MRLVAITGGIGSGKSVVSDVLRAMGYTVYDCDSEARRLMDGDLAMRRRIFDEICPAAEEPDGSIDRRTLAAAVFPDSAKLAALNAIVHGAVRTDLLSRAAEVSDVMFFESAILRSSGFVDIADVVWVVTAPVELRIRRVMSRNGIGRDEVVSRIDAQIREAMDGLDSVSTILNDGVAPLLPQIEEALAELF